LPRLQDLETNALECLSEARQRTWLGEVAALEESLRQIREKHAQAALVHQRIANGDHLTNG
jgi:hypothetical protein